MSLRSLHDFDLDAFSESYRKRMEEIDKWKKKQPEFIAVEMTNEEITAVIYDIRPNDYIIESQDTVITLLICKDNIKVIEGKLYKKVLNPKTYNVKVIPW